MRPRYRITLCLEAQEVSIFNPVLLQELICVWRGSTQEDEKDAAAQTIVFEHSILEGRPIRVTVTDDSVQIHVIQQRQWCVAGIHPADMRSQRAAEAFRVFAVEEVVHLLKI